MMKNPETSKRLLIALQNSGISQRELSELAGIKESSVSHYVNGSHAPSTINAGKMGNVLHVNPLWLMGYENTAMISEEPIGSSLTPPELKLIKIFNEMNDDGQGMLVEYAEYLSCNSKYKK